MDLVTSGHSVETTMRGSERMAKRFTDTTKWKRPWFRSLGLHGKVLWQYLIDDCDHAGLWIADFDLVSFQVGFKVDEPRLAELLGDKIVKIADDKYFIPSFFEFQYADCKDGFKAKQSALKLLRAWNLLDESDSLKDLTDSYLTVPIQSVDCHIKIKSKIKIKSNTGSAEGGYTPEFEALWKTYPRKTDKVSAFKAFTANVPPEDIPLVPRAIENYRAELKRDHTEAKYIKHGATFFNAGRWRGWLDPSHGSEDFSEGSGQIDWTKFETPGGAA